LFDVWFPAVGAGPGGVPGAGREGRPGADVDLMRDAGIDAAAAAADADADAEAHATLALLAAAVEAALASGDPARLAALARLAVARFSGMAGGRLLGTAWHVHQAWRALDVDGALARLLGAGAGRDPDDLDPDGLDPDDLAAGTGPLARRLAAD